MTIISRIQRGIAQFLFWWSVQSFSSKMKTYKQVSLSMEFTKHLSKKRELTTIWRLLPHLRGCPLSVDVPLYPPQTTISKWRVTATLRQLLRLPTGGTSAFGGLRATAALRRPSNFWNALVFSSHQLPLYGNECLEWQIPTRLS